MSGAPAADGAGLLLALHSCTETLGVGLAALPGADTPGAVPTEPLRLASFPLGRALSNHLLASIETVLPAAEWPRLARLAVATGPGGFTGTRLTVVLARTLAQQLGLPLHGISSFLLVARRLWQAGHAPDDASFWLVQELPRHGLVAGLYQADPDAPGGIAERQAPRLRPPAEATEISGGTAARVEAVPRLPEDAAELLAFGRAAAAAGLAAPWQTVLPIYPTSPVSAG